MKIKISFLTLTIFFVLNNLQAATDDFSKVSTAVQLFQADDFQGSGSTSIPIIVPTGRKNIQPDINIQYKSNSGNGWIGVGWNLNLGFIERVTKKGIPKYNSQDLFFVSLQGINSELQKGYETYPNYNPNEYYPKSTATVVKFLFKNPYWEAYDKEGRRYIFGQTPDSRIETGKGTFRWALNKVIDTCGNYMTIAYYNNGYQHFPSRIEYTGNETVSELPTHKVEFILEDRQDIISDYRNGYKSIIDKRLTEIRASVSNNLVNRYLFEYIYSSQTKRSLLSKSTLFGSDGITNLPPMIFTYQDAGLSNYTKIYIEPQTGNKLWCIKKSFGWFGNTSGTLYPGRLGSNSFEGGGRLFWYTMPSISQSGEFWDIDEKGRLIVNLPEKVAFHAWTYVYVETAKSISIPITGSGNFFFWLNGDYSLPVNPQQINLKTGANIIEITGYNSAGPCNFDLNYALSDNVTRMHSNQFAIPQLSGDFNGDGLMDLATYYASNGRIKVSLSNGNSFQVGEYWSILPGGGFPMYLEPKPFNLLLGDFNMDTTTDIMAFNEINQVEVISSSPKKYFVNEGGGGKIFSEKGNPFAADFNNDGKADIGLQAENANDILIASASQVGGFDLGVYWLYNFPGKILIGDFNGDGLIDIGSFDSSQAKVSVALNKGDAFATPDTWITNFNPPSEITTADYNKDGLTDVVYYDKTNGRLFVMFSDGRQFLPPAVYLSGFSFKDSDAILQASDFNGDGASDFYLFNPYTQKTELAYSTPAFVDLLIRVENGAGGETRIEYDLSTNYDNTVTDLIRTSVPEYKDFYGEGLPFCVPVVRKITVYDGIGNSYASHYSYKGGFYDKIDREFRGFGYINIIDNEGSQRETYFKQDDIYKGLPYRQEYRDSPGNLYLRIENTWINQSMKDYAALLGHLVLLKKQEKFTYDGDQTYKCSFVTSEYSAAYGPGSLFNPNSPGGDPTRVLEGVTVTAAERQNIMGYVWQDGERILTRPSLIYASAITTPGNWVSGWFGIYKKQLYYDGNTSLDAKPTKGLLTMEKVFTVDKKGVLPETDNISALITTYSYDIYGNMISKTGPENHTATVTFDSTYHIYPVEERNASGHITKKTYDPKTGRFLTSTDANNQVTTYLYDTFGRLTKVIGPNDTTQYPATIYDYDMSACPYKVIKSQKTAYPSTYTAEISFYDGLGRLVETKVDSEADPVNGEPRQIVKDIVAFNSQGKIKEKYNPFITAGYSSVYSAPGPSVGKTTFEYDCLGRTTRVINPDSTYRTVQYSDWTETKTDENDRQVRSTYDAFNRLIQQEEFNQGEVYATKYSYDLYYYNWYENLSAKEFRITDAKNNVTSIIYDLSDRKVKMADPDMGTWTYTYDKAGNLKTQKDAKGQLLAFSYDTINRLVSKAYPDGKTISYYYDDIGKQYCKGRLSYIIDFSGRKDFYYDNLGREIKVTQVIDGISYIIEKAYNAMNQVTGIKYPDGETINYTYNTRNSIDKIIGNSTYVSNVDYAPTGEMLKVNYGNGTYTDYAYDSKTLRLTELKTNNGSLQDLNYRYDNVGNISRITDYRNLATQDFAYDELNRLTSAGGAYGNFSYQYDAIGNMINKEGKGYIYGQSGSKPHAVVSGPDGFSAVYDANGNMTGQNNRTLTYDYDNRLIKYQGTAGNNPVTIEVSLTVGWNFISLPLIVDNNSITSVLSSISGQYDQVSRFNPATGKFEHFVNDAAYNQFTSLETGKGYQMYITNPAGCSLRITGNTLTANYNISLSTGWQMLGYPSNNRIKVSDALSSLVKGTNYDRICRFNKTTHAFIDLAATDYLEPGEAYFLHMLSNSTLVATPTPSIELTEFTYDADGNRVKKLFNGQATVYIGGFYEKTGSLTTKHIYLGSTRAVSKSAAQTLYYHSDHLGSSNVITDSTGSQVQLSEYKPFGEFYRNTSSRINYYFTGKELDSSGLYYYGARYYDPKIGRFITADPIEYSDEGIKIAGGKNLETFLKNPQNLNRYAYCLGNPIKYTDSMGLLTIFIHGTFSSISDVSSDFISSVKSTFNDNFSSYLFQWSGANTNQARFVAAFDLASFINHYNFVANESLNIVGYSHGGNIAFLTSQFKLKHKIDTLVTLGTPLREYRPNMTNIGKLYNVSSYSDWVQTHGGKDSWYGIFIPGEAGPSGNILNNSSNPNIVNIIFDVITHFGYLNKETWDEIFN